MSDATADRSPFPRDADDHSTGRSAGPARPSTPPHSPANDPSPDRDWGPPNVADPPTGWGHVTWLGPGFLWMVSAAGSGELLFTPRIGSLYGYAFI